MLDITSVKLTATPGDSGWAQVHDFIPEDPDKLRIRGRLFAVVATKKVGNDFQGESGGIETVEAGRELLSRLHEEYFGNLYKKSFDALKDATQKVLDEFKSVWGDVEIAACSIVGDIVYSSSRGGAKVMISRNGALATILESPEEGVITASGRPQEGDIILLGTRIFFESIPQETIKDGIAAPNLGLCTDFFAPIIHSGQKLGKLGAAIIKFGEKGETFITNTQAEKSAPANYGQKFSSLMAFISKKLPKRQIYIKETVDDATSSQSKKLTFSVGIILLIILAVSIGFGVRQKRINDIKNKYEGILSEAQNEVDEAIGLSSVSPERSRELFISSQEKLKEIEALNVTDSKVTELKNKIDESREAILGEYQASPEPFLDLSLLSSGFKGDELTTSGGNVYILDKNGKKIVSVTISSKKSKVVAGPSVIDVAKNMASYEDRLFILSDDGIYEVGGNKTKVVEKTWDGEALIRAFAGNIYVLDKSHGAIYRYAGSGNSFGDKQNWLSNSTNADFASARQWVIDGSIYVQTSNSKILKYSLGSPQSFKISGAIPEIGTVDAIYASDETQFVYLLDRAGKRVVVTDKKGGYKAQYINDGIENATNLVVSEKDKKILLLTGDKLLSIEIKHL